MPVRNATTIWPCRTVCATPSRVRNGTGNAPMPYVTRDVGIADLANLLAHPPRASVAFVHDGAVDVLPVRARCTAETHRFAVASGAAPSLDAREVVLLIEDGSCAWFGLRGVSVRGVAARIEAPAAEGSDDVTWYAIEPSRVLAWDYGALRAA